MSNTTGSWGDVNLEIWYNFLSNSLEEEPYWMKVVYVLAMTTIFFVSLVGNLLTCIVIYHDRTMHTATNYYLFNLAVSDLILTFGILAELFQYTANYRYEPVVCQIHYFFILMLWNHSILIMTVLAIERYIAVWYPLMLKSSRPVWRRVMKVIVLIWIIAIVEALPEIWTVEVVHATKDRICCVIPTPFAKVVNGVLALVTFVIPLGIMLLLYTLIAFKVHSNEKTNPVGKIFNHRDHRSKVNKLIMNFIWNWCSVAMTVSFMVCWLPFFTMRVLIFACNLRQIIYILKWWIVWERIVAFNNWFSIVLNPILFSLMSTKFRKALTTMWREKIKCQQSKTLRV